MLQGATRYDFLRQIEKFGGNSSVFRRGEPEEGVGVVNMEKSGKLRSSIHGVQERTSISLGAGASNKVLEFQGFLLIQKGHRELLDLLGVNRQVLKVVPVHDLGRFVGEDVA